MNLFILNAPNGRFKFKALHRTFCNFKRDLRFPFNRAFANVSAQPICRCAAWPLIFRMGILIGGFRVADFDTQVRESQAQVAEAQAKIAELTGRIETARAKMKTGDDITFDIENATLEDVHAHTELMNANIAELIMGLDDVTTAFSKDFDEMRSKTGMESFIGIFSKAKADSMRQERMRTASIDDKLQDLISKSDVIMQLLEGQLTVLNEQKVSVEKNLGGTLEEREMTVGELEALRADILGMDPKIIELENKIS